MSPASNVTPIQNDEEWDVKVESFPETFVFENPGDMLVGTFVSEKEITQEGLDGNPRQVKIYSIEDSNGKKWGVWGSWAIDTAFADIEKGQLCKIVYEGTESIHNGKQSVKKFNVAVKR